MCVFSSVHRATIPPMIRGILASYGYNSICRLITDSSYMRRSYCEENYIPVLKNPRAQTILIYANVPMRILFYFISKLQYK